MEKGIIKFYDESLWEDKYLQEAAVDSWSHSFPSGCLRGPAACSLFVGGLSVRSFQGGQARWYLQDWQPLVLGESIIHVHLITWPHQSEIAVNYYKDWSLCEFYWSLAQKMQALSQSGPKMSLWAIVKAVVKNSGQFSISHPRPITRFLSQDSIYWSAQASLWTIRVSRKVVLG